MTKVSQNSTYSPTLCLKVPKSPSKKSHASRALQQYQECAPISINNFLKILLVFKNDLISNNSCIICINIMKAPNHTHTHGQLSNNTKSAMKGAIV
jgi:hypothetical protein